MASAMTTDTITVKGREFHMFKEPVSGRWRVRKRTEDVYIDKSTGCTELTEARRWAKVFVEKELGNAYRLATGGHTLEEVVQAYLSFPKPVRPYVADANVARLRSIVQVAMGKELHEVRARAVTYRLWEDFIASKHGGRVDLSTPRRENISIMGAVRSACSVFPKKLDHRYAEAGINLDFANLRRVPSLPVTSVARHALPDGCLDKLLAAWNLLKTSESASDRAVYTTVGLALHAGLRSSEIAAAQKHWLAASGTEIKVVLKNRPEEGFRTKTDSQTLENSWLSGLVIDLGFAFHLMSLPEGKLVQYPQSSEDWFFNSVVNRWIRQFITKEMDGKGLHRLRAEYANSVKLKYGDRILANQVGIDAARLALGHTTSGTTLRHYLQAQ
jgi:integrase